MVWQAFLNELCVRQEIRSFVTDNTIFPKSMVRLHYTHHTDAAPALHLETTVRFDLILAVFILYLRKIGIHRLKKLKLVLSTDVSQSNPGTFNLVQKFQC